MTITAHGATLDVTADAVIITRSLLSTCLGAQPRQVVALSDIAQVTVVAPTAAGFGHVDLTGNALRERVRFAPGQDATRFSQVVSAALEGRVPAAAPEHADDAVGRSDAAGADVDLTGLDFTAVDVETANWNWGSICQIGAVRFRDGAETESRSWLCTPPPGLEDFDEVNIGIHGISPEDVKDAPRFVDAAAELVDFLGDDLFIAHNAQFDSSALRAAFQAAGCEVPTLTFACSLALARHASTRGVITVANHKLPTVAKAVGLDEFRHHDACEDARAAGIVIVGLARALGQTGSLTELFISQEFTLGHMNNDEVMPVLRSQTAPTSPADLGAGTDFREDTRNAGIKKDSKKGTRKTPGRQPAPWETVATPEKTPEPNKDADPNNPLFGAHVTLTGDFDPFDKGLLWQEIARRGGQVGKNVTKKTTVLVIGTWATKTAKEKRAEELIDKGQDIALWDSAKLIDVLGLEEQPPF